MARPIHLGLEGLESALRGAVYPLEREELIWVARENEAPSELVSRFSRLPGGCFSSADSVAAALQAAGDTPALQAADER